MGLLFLLGSRDSTTAVKDPVQLGSVVLGPSYQDIAIQGRYAYVVSITDDVLKVVDVSDPLRPRVVGVSAPLGAISGNVVRLAVSGRYGYVVDLNSNVLRVVDISDSTSPRLVSRLTLPNDSIADVAASGLYAYVVDLGISPGDDDNFTIVDITNPLAPRVASVLFLNPPPRGLMGPYDMLVEVVGSYAYVLDAAPAGEKSTFRVIDVSHPSSPSVTAILGLSFATRSSFGGLAISGHYGYFISGTGSKFQVVDVTSPFAPLETGNLALDNGVAGLAVSGRYGYIVSTSDTFKIIDLAFPAAPKVIGSAFITLTSGASVAVADHYGYVVNDDPISGNLTIFDLGDLTGGRLRVAQE
ncbi:MAG: hypothetical protein HYT46_01655 [Candidatus Vogelbacteria bacterium]|nr:hypothetical protein [Candidatus Vogelbacteria bacterium]